MPELPEVHTTVTGLATVLPGLEIIEVWSDWPKQIKSHNFETFRQLLIGKKFLNTSRQAKNVLMHLGPGHRRPPSGASIRGWSSENLTLRVHMKMTGHLMYGRWVPFEVGKIFPPNLKIRTLNGMGRVPSWLSMTRGAFDDPYNQYIHFIITLSNGYQLALSDLRKFARIELLETSNLAEHETLKSLGPDPFEAKLTPKVLYDLLQKKPRLPIKLALMDQTILSGIGNIYADETLWDAGILPTRKVSTISLAEIGSILRSVRRIMTQSIKIGGDSKSDYRNIYGERGGFQNHHMAYHMYGKACTKRGCGGIIQRIKLGGRSAHFCPVHQS